MKKPPDKYRTLKISLKQIIKKDVDYSVLHDAIDRTNKLVIHVYQFLRLWILNKYHKKQDIPEITKDIIQMAFKALTTESSGPKPKGTNLKYYEEFLKFYDNTYKKLNYKDKIDGNNLSQIIGYMCTDMVTNIENNIKLHFMDYVRRVVNCNFKEQNNKILEDYKGKEKVDMRKQLAKELYELKTDLFNNTQDCDKKYHKWLKKYKNKILPPKTKEMYQANINDNPQKYIKYMIYMNIELEKLEKKMFQFFPLRTEIKPHYIPIDTKSIIELFVSENKNDYLGDIYGTKKGLWKQYFNTGHKIFKQKKYIFDCRILTDGYAVSIQFIHNDEVKKEEQKKQNMKLGRQKMKELTKDMTQEQKEELKLKIKQEKKNKEKELRKKKKEEFKKLSKEEQKKIKESINKKYIEFPYLDEIDEDELKEVQNSLKVYVDPGKKCLIYMMDDNGNILKYTNKRRIHETKRLKYQRLLHNYKKKNSIDEVENQLKDFNSKTCNLVKFKKYIKEKNKINSELFAKYNASIFRQYKWYGYLNRERSEDKLLNEIENKFGKNCKIQYGNWNVTKQMRNFISTPGIGLKRKVAERFSVYNLDEFRTSCLNYKTETKCENLYVQFEADKKEESRKLHAVLTYQMENKRYGCVNRDLNSVKNMKKIVDYWFIHKERPLRYRRAFDLKTNQLKDSNPRKGKTLKASSRVKPNDGK